MENNIVKAFFDKCAHNWDEYNTYNEVIVKKILDNAKINGDIEVLDVASGTGVLFDEYLKRGVKFIGIDLSSEMVKIARNKYPNVDIRLGDINTYCFDKTFDVIMIYNAMPHFIDVVSLIKKLDTLVKPKGIISIAHGISKRALDSLHKNEASEVSNELLEVEDLAKLFETKYDIECMISDDIMYQLVVKKR